MKNVMHKGELFGTINLDTIQNKTHLYGLGPLEYLRGELLIIDGKSYKSTIADDGSILMEETYKAKAPFFVYANAGNWEEIKLPDSIATIPQLENYLDKLTPQHERPFCFKLAANIDSAIIHVVNLPEGTKVSSPEEAHQEQRNFLIKNETVELIGFFSTEHQAVFTHHDTYVHIHLITSDKKSMGHVEELHFKKGETILFIPEK